MDLGLSGRVAVVTGGGKGIGRAEVLALAREGASVAVIDVDPAREEVASEIRALGAGALAVEADVSSSSAVKEMADQVYEQFGRIDILVNNAGIFGEHLHKSIMDMTETSWEAMLGVHLRGSYLCAKYLAPYMVRQKWGRVINTSSIHARTGARLGFASYTTSKGGIEAFTMTAAKELGPRGITVNAVAPGYVRTTSLAFSPEQYHLIAKQVPMGRLAEPEDIANCVVFLASQAASYINGTVVEVNGGRREFYFGG